MKKLTLWLVVAVMIFSTLPVNAQNEYGTIEAGVVGVIQEYFDDNYNYDIDYKQVFEKVVKTVLEKNPELYTDILKSMAESLDEYTEYYTKEEFEQFYAYVQSEIAGIGAYLERDEEYVRISSVISNSPAEKAGLQANDRILSSDGVSLKNAGPEYAASIIRGEKGTSVKLEIERNGIVMDFTVTRDQVSTSTVSGGMESDETGYISILSFNSSTAEDFALEFGTLAEQGATKFIIDLRNNTGGVTEEALAVASLFLPDNTNLMTIKNKNSGESIISTNEEGFTDCEIVVLVNEYTASASEILTAALKYNDRAVIVGKNTFGKGTMQNTTSLGTYGGIKLTVAEFCGPYGEQINGSGIAPDIWVENIEEELPDDYFPILKYEQKYKLGDSSSEIKVLKEMLYTLGYVSYANLDEYFDKSLYYGVKNFQKENGLFSYGELDFTTQIAITNMSKNASVLTDKQYQTALDILK